MLSFTASHQGFSAQRNRCRLKVFTSTGSSSMVPAHAVTIVNAVKNPNLIRFVKEEDVRTRNPKATARALNVMAFPVILIPF